MTTKIEIGGGDRNRGDGWVNVDMLPCANIQHDLNILPWPIADESADEVYSSHCIEHVNCHRDFLRECARIGKIGASVEIRCPDAMGEMAMCPGHNYVLGVMAFLHADRIFPERVWGDGLNRRLRLNRIETGADDYWFHKARSNPLFREYTNQDILDYVPRTCHERNYHFVVEEFNGFQDR